MRPIQHAIWFIERHLNQAIGLDEIASSAGVSRFHLSRAFGYATGLPVIAYVRARRLSEAALRLKDGAPDILALAVDLGYGSHEAFTRAFREQFDATPETVRAEGIQPHMQLTKAIRMPDTPSLTLKAPRLIEAKARTIAGLTLPITNMQTAGIPGLWQSFRPHYGHINGQVGGHCFGVSYDFAESGDFTYMAGVEVSDTRDLPKNFSHVTLRAMPYAVFEHNGHVSGIGATWMAIFDQGLMDKALQGLSFQGDPSFELMTEDFDGETGLGRIEIWIPMRKA